MARLTTEDAVCEAAPKAGHRVAVFSVSSVLSVLSVVFPKPKFQKITKSPYLARCMERQM